MAISRTNMRNQITKSGKKKNRNKTARRQPNNNKS